MQIGTFDTPAVKNQWADSPYLDPKYDTNLLLHKKGFFKPEIVIKVNCDCG